MNYKRTRGHPRKSTIAPMCQFSRMDISAVALKIYLLDIFFRNINETKQKNVFMPFHLYVLLFVSKWKQGDMDSIRWLLLF